MTEPTNPAENPANETPAPAPAPAASLRDAKLESAHADLPPMSVIGGDSTPAAKPGEIAPPKSFGRRGTPQGGGKGGAGAPAPAIGAVTNPADLTEKLSGDLAKGDAQAPRAPREPRAPRPEGEFRGPREDRGPRPEGDFRPRRDDRGPRPDGEFRPRRDDRGPRPDGERRRDDRAPVPERARIHIEPVVIPLEPPRSLWGSIKRLAATLWGVPRRAEYTPAPRAPQGNGHREDRRGDDRGHHRGGRNGQGQRGGRGDRGGRGGRGGRGPRG